MDEGPSLPVVVSCEHAGHEVPEEWSRLFVGRSELLESHRGWDPGASEIAECMARRLRVPLLAHRTTRLLVDANRSLGHRQLFSEITAPLTRDQRSEILERYFHPHRTRVNHAVEELIESHGVAVHLGVHTFTPVLDGVERRTDLGLLYDPSRPTERTLVGVWKEWLEAVLPGWTIHRNQPYKGNSDGLTTTLRRLHPDPRYLGVEIEIRSDLAHGPGSARSGACPPAELVEGLTRTLSKAVGDVVPGDS